MQVKKMSSNNLFEQVYAICDSNNPSLVVLTSMNIEVRNGWIRAFNEAKYHLWAHSMRIIRHIEGRLYFEGENAIDSVYNVIYGGVDSENKDNQSDESNDSNSEEIDDGSQVTCEILTIFDLEDQDYISYLLKEAICWIIILLSSFVKHNC